MFSRPLLLPLPPFFFHSKGNANPRNIHLTTDYAMSSAFNHRTDARDTPSFRRRAAADGLYTFVLASIKSMGKTFLGECNIGEDFHKKPESRSKHYGYVGGGGAPFSANVIGEIAGFKYSAHMGAAGYHYFGSETRRTPIDDQTRVKQQMVLCCPSFAPEALKEAYRNQIVTLSEMRNEDVDDEDEDVIAKEGIRAAEPAEDTEPDLLVLTFPQAYTTTARNESPLKGKRKDPLSKRAMKKRKIDESEVAESESPGSSQSNDAPSSPIRGEWRPLENSDLPSDQSVRVDAEYPPNVYPDYGGPLFRHRMAKAKQLNIRDSGNTLIPPWKYWSMLTPGTLVMANISIMVWVMPSDRGSATYHLVVRSLRVLGRSDIEVPRPVPNLSGNIESASETPTVADSASLALSSLVLPADMLDDRPLTSSLPSFSSPGASSSSTVTDLGTETFDMDVENLQDGDDFYLNVPDVPAASGRKNLKRRK
ncbi:hypothetical protein PQX77_007994 [Marasmius sp. AFHP31]|nr:hypothetical protein PQX77_007994 [Marasmius sp. AFHP31]